MVERECTDVYWSISIQNTRHSCTHSFHVYGFDVREMLRPGMIQMDLPNEKVKVSTSTGNQPCYLVGFSYALASKERVISISASRTDIDAKFHTC